MIGGRPVPAIHARGVGHRCTSRQSPTRYRATISRRSRGSSEQIPRARATLLSINTSLNAASVAIGVTLGGTIIDLAGFPVLGAVFAGLLLSSAALLLTFARHTTALVDAAA